MERKEDGRSALTGEREEFEEGQNGRTTTDPQGMGGFGERENGRRRTGQRGLLLIDALVSIFHATVRGGLGSKYFDQNQIF